MVHIDDPEAPEDFDPKFDLDLDAADDQTAQEAEAKKKTIRVHVGGRWIEFPPLNEWEYYIQEMIADGLLMEALAEVLDDPDTIEHLRKQPGQKIVNLMEHLDKVSGVKTRDFRSSNRASRRSRQR